MDCDDRFQPALTFHPEVSDISPLIPMSPLLDSSIHALSPQEGALAWYLQAVPARPSRPLAYFRR